MKQIFIISVICLFVSAYYLGLHVNDEDNKKTFLGWVLSVLSAIAVLWIGTYCIDVKSSLENEPRVNKIILDNCDSIAKDYSDITVLFPKL